MSAKDYKICCGWSNAYIAKVSKRTPNLMLNDRRVIEVPEIMELIKFHAQRECEKNNTDTVVITCGGKPVIEMSLKGEWLEELNLENNK